MLHIAERHAGLLPDDANARARAIAWMFAALNTVELPILDLAVAKFLEGDKPWTAERLELIKERIRKRLHDLSTRLGDTDWLDGTFSAGDLLMVHALQRLKPSGLLEEYPNLAAYIARAEERPAFKRAFSAQLAMFAGNQPGKKIWTVLGKTNLTAVLLARKQLRLIFFTNHFVNSYAFENKSQNN